VNRARSTLGTGTGRSGHLTLDVEVLTRRRRQREDMHALPIDADLEILLADEVRDVGVDSATDTHFDVVVAVARGEVIHTRPATCAHRHAFETHILIELG